MKFETGRKRGGRGVSLEIPVSVNQVLDLEIETLVQGGEGLAKLDNFAVFVPQGIPGDQVRVKIISVKPNYARGLISTVLKPSGLRVKPLCPVTTECGGCQWQEMDYRNQLETKENNLTDNLERIGGLPPETVENARRKIIGMENPYYYRNKAIFPFAREKDKVKGGFYYPKSHNIVEFEKCYIQSDKINFIYRKVRSLLKKYDISIYDEKKHKGFFRHLLVRHAFTTNQVMVGFITTSGKFPEINKITDELSGEFPEIVGIVQNINDKPTNVILGDKNKILYGQDYIIEQLEDMKFKISLNSFFQVNPIQAVKIYNTVLEYAALTGTETVLDAYSGAGTIALWLARYAAKVLGIESVKAAVEDGMENARLNNISNFSFRNGKVEEILPTVLEKNAVDTVILDPPRKGCEDYIFAALAEFNIRKIIYVSCNPATLARDAALLTGSGYELTSFQPVDMFPHTYHLETVALFCKS
jgi:23S rRNA (uracil1939-C5)-methyltransferase